MDFAGNTRTVIHLVEDWDKIARESDSEMDRCGESDSLIYVMYTSGSTGKPKGVCILHRSVLRLVQDSNYADLSGQVMLQFAPISFDVSTFEIWGSLLNGGRLSFMAEGRAGLEALGRAIQRERITTLWLTAGLFHEMVDHHIAGLHGVGQLLAGGDVLSAEHARQFLKANPGSCVINGYGPTECTTFSCCFRTDNLEARTDTVPIGWPINKTQVYVLDEQQELVGTGATGELYIGGEGLARGYLNRADQTAEKFVPDPFSGASGERLYRTGDLVCRRGDDALEFLGRIDGQVKIRGYRIELGEIETALRRHSEVRDAAVLAWETRLGTKRLVAYLVAGTKGQPVAGSELRNYLARTLPEYMLPAQFVWVERLPLTSQGKVARQALPPPQTEHPSEPPQTETEALMASACSKILSPSPISLDASFLELGGSSLNAMRLVSALRETALLDIPLRELLGSKTLREITQEAWEHRVSDNTTGPSRLMADNGPKPASYSQERVWFIDQMAASNLAYHFVAKITFFGILDIPALAKALGQIVARHEIYRTTLTDIEGQLFQIVHPPWTVVLEPIEAEEGSGEEAEILRQESQRPPAKVSSLPSPFT